MIGLVARLILAALFIEAPGAWHAPADSQTTAGTEAMILGRVVDAQTDRPLAGVVVVLGGGPAEVAGPRQRPEPRVLTDPEGRFLFRGLTPGAYRLAAVVGGNGFSPNGFIVTGLGFPIGAYLNGGFGQTRPNGPLQPLELAEGQRMGDAVIRLWKSAAVTGRVLDEAGEPLVDQVVGIVQVAGGGQLENGPTLRTDDRGMYRFGSLAPGRYIVFVPQTHVSMPVSVGEELVGAPDALAANRFSLANAPPPQLGGVRVGGSVVGTTPDAGRFGGRAYISNGLPPLRDGDRVLAYRATFYPSVATLDAATSIVVQAAEERAGVDVLLAPVPATSISGVVLDDRGPVPHIGVHLMPGDTSDQTSILEAATTSTDGTGAFTFPVVPAGRYTVMVWRIGGVPTGDRQRPVADPTRLAEHSGAWAAQSVSVGEQPIENVTVTMRRPLNVSGRVEFRGSSERPPAERLRTGYIVTIPRSRTLFRSPGPTPGSTIDLDAGGRFEVRGLSPPGRFLVGAPNLPPPWSLESVTLEGRNITDASFLIEDDDVSELIITYTDQPASVSGSVQSAAGAFDPGTSVLLFPADRARWEDDHRGARSYRISRISTTGAFTFPNVPPGEYLLAALLDEQIGQWPDQVFLSRVAGAAGRVRVVAGQGTTVSLTVGEIR